MGENNMNEDVKVIIREDVLLEKFDGDPEDGNVVERVYLTDGVMTKHEYLEDGEVVKVVEPQGGETIGSN
jgi:hypothetical protein